MSVLFNGLHPSSEHVEILLMVRVGMEKQEEMWRIRIQLSFFDVDPDLEDAPALDPP